jgi:hypothetical protein
MIDNHEHLPRRDVVIIVGTLAALILVVMILVYVAYDAPSSLDIDEQSIFLPLSFR